jgi:hypothetical protein
MDTCDESSRTCPFVGESWTVVDVKGMARLDLAKSAQRSKRNE